MLTVADWASMTAEERREAQKEIRARRAEVWRLKNDEDLPHHEIMKRMGLGYQTVCHDLKAWARKIYKEEYENIITAKTEDLKRIERVMRPMEALAMEGNVKAAGMVNSLITQRAKLLGTYVPTKHVVAVLNSQAKPKKQALSASQEQRLLNLVQKLDRIGAPISSSVRIMAQNTAEKLGVDLNLREQKQISVSTVDGEIVSENTPNSNSTMQNTPQNQLDAMADARGDTVAGHSPESLRPSPEAEVNEEDLLDFLAEDSDDGPAANS